MANKIKKIISFTTTETNKSFCLEVEKPNSTVIREMYYANIEDKNKHIHEDGIFYNKGCLINHNYISCYTTIYNIKDLYLKSAIYGNNIYYTFPNTHNFQNVFNYRLSNDITNQIQVDNYIYQLNTDLCNIGKYCFTQDVYSELSMNNGYIQMPHNLISTCTFNKDDVSKAISGLIDEIEPNNINTNVKYNHFLEIPGDIKNDYSSGNYAANIYTTKNQYNSEYNMTHNTNYFLTNARRYIAIDHCNDQIYLKYYDDVYYTKNGKQSIDSQLYNQKFQRLEVIKALNRYEDINKHKTNYYDIDIICEKLFNDFNDVIKKVNNNIEQQKINIVKQNLKHEITNCIIDICKNITPVDTQLVKVNVLENNLGLE